MIEITGLSKAYTGSQGRFEALRGIDLQIGGGEIFGIIGPSGAGKSTLVQCINLLQQPDSGHIRLAGQMLTGLDEAALRAQRRRVGMVFQGFHLMNRRTVFDNVALPLEIAKVPVAEIAPRVEQLLALVGLSALGDRYPAQLSGGQKQRVGIARALANHPDVLLSDEATSALDPETTATILALLREINRQTGITIVMITHQMDVVRQICHRVAVLDQGQVVETGDTQAVFRAPQHPVTCAMVGAVAGSDLSAESLEAVRARLIAARAQQPDTTFALWRLSIADSQSERSLSESCREHGVRYSTVQARIEDVQGMPVGTLFVEMAGDASALMAVSDRLACDGIEWRVLDA